MNTAVNTPRHLPLSLLLLRLGVFIVMFMWTLDKFVQPGHASAVFENFYGLEGLGSTVFLVVGGLQMLVVAELGRPRSYRRSLIRRVPAPRARPSASAMNRRHRTPERYR